MTRRICPRQPKFSQRKFDALVLHICKKMLSDPHFDDFMLNLILQKTDFMHFGKYGKPLTGATYVKIKQGVWAKQWGPTPHPNRKPRWRKHYFQKLSTT